MFYNPSRERKRYKAASDSITPRLISILLMTFNKMDTLIAHNIIPLIKFPQVYDFIVPNRTDYYQDILEFNLDGNQVTIIGVSHGNIDSINLSRQTVIDKTPDLLLLELDSMRVQAMPNFAANFTRDVDYARSDRYLEAAAEYLKQHNSGPDAKVLQVLYYIFLKCEFSQ